MDRRSEKPRDFSFGGYKYLTIYEVYQWKTTPFTSSSSSSSGNHLRSMKPQKRKCSSENHAGRDRLSEMPDEVIVHILSYLTIFDAVGTMLIRPFGNLWTLVPSLNFHIEEVFGRNDVMRFFIFARNVMMRHKRPFIDIFRLYFYFDYYHDVRRRELGGDIRMCLKFALDKQAKVIYFSDSQVDYSETPDYPNFISQSLVTLTLSTCEIYPELQVDLGSLKKLILEDVTMSEETFQQFICGCPSLQELRICNPRWIKNLSFSAPNIRKLFLEFGAIVEDDDPWLLDFPNLQILDLNLYRIPDIDHIDFSSVRYVNLRVFRFEVDDENKLDENKLRMFKLLLEKLSQSEVFRLSEYASEPFHLLLDDLHLLQIRWKRVDLPLRIFCQSCLLGVFQLMRSLTVCEELDIYTHTYACQASVDLPPVELSDHCVMPKLKTVTLHGYAKPWKHQLQLIEFLLKSATALEKLVIVQNKGQFSLTEKLEFVLQVSSFQRSSPNARVLFL